MLSQEPAKAILTCNIFESAGNVVVQASGSLDLSTAVFRGNSSCATPLPGGIISSSFGAVCTGPESSVPTFLITGPATFDGSVLATPASSVSGIFAGFASITGVMGIDSSYIYNTPIISSATYLGQTLASLGFTTTGLIGTWTINGTSESIQVFLGPPSPSGAAVPGPLPLLGAGAAFGWSRRLRKRIATPLITPPQI